MGQGRLFLTYALCMSLMGSGWAELAVRVEGVSRSLESMLRPLAISSLEEMAEDTALQRARADGAADMLRRRLQSLGYLEAVVRADLTLQTVVFECDLGKRFQVDRVRWELLEDSQGRILPAWPEEATEILLRHQLGRWKGRPLAIEPLVAEQNLVIEELRAAGYAFAEAQTVKLRADTLTQQVNVSLPLALGPRIRLGATSVDGLERLEARWVEQRLLWCEGSYFNPTLFEQTRSSLLQSDLFNQVELRLGAPDLLSGLTPVLITAQERKPRTLSAGVTYATTEGVGGLLGWENRNVSGMGERLAADLVIAQVIQELTLSGMRQLEDRPAWTTKGFAVVRRKHILSYLERSADLALLVEWSCSPQLVASVGLKAEGLTVRDSPQNGQNLIGSIPLFFDWSSGSDTQGGRWPAFLQARASPTAALGDPSSVFFPFRLAAGIGIPLGPCTLSARASFGSILGAALETIPLPLRFFEGSVDGLRGYAYQTVSPLDPCGIPIGGRSLLIVNGELEVPITSSIDLIPFVDSGNVFAQQWPDFSIRPLSSVGVGIRWNSFFGPLRLDFAYPLNRRPDLDRSFSIYGGVGHAF
jgi:translocation and assembly module TamA